MGVIATTASPGSAELASKPGTPQPDFGALGLLDEEDMMDVGDERMDEAIKEKAPTPPAVDVVVTAGIVTPYRTRHLTKHVDMLWRRTAGETHDFKPVRVLLLSTFYAE